MENARAALSLARIAGNIGFAGLPLIAFSPLFSGLFYSLFRNLEQGFHALFKILLGLFSFVIFVFFWHKISPTMKALVIAFIVLIPSGQAQNKPTSANNKACCKAYPTANKLPITAILAANEGESRTSDQQHTETTKETRILGLSRDGFAQVLVSFILAIITGIYAFLTWRMLHKVGAQVAIMQKQVENAGEQLIAARISNQVMFQQIGQMRIANEQTGRLIEEARISADAAKKSADALVASERAWLKIDLTTSIALSGFTAPPHLPFIRFRPIITNVGRTPARIVEIYGRADRLVKTVDDGIPERPPVLPQEPDYTESRGWISKREAIVPPNHDIDWFGIHTASDIDDIKTRKEFLYIYGYVNYIDVAGNKRQTRYCRIYWIPYGISDPVEEGFHESAIMPPAYTKST